MSEIAGRTGLRGGATAVVNESYSFACMRCGHGWEQAYEIEHHTDGDGTEYVVYVADGKIVPSPLSQPTCQNCDNHVVRIMRAGQVSSVQSHLRRQAQRASAPGEPGGTGEPAAQEATAVGAQHHWHLADLLHPFHRKVG
ncbi:hypothetical protein [Streptomyces mangrovisoli]|uniref:C2H2-type domain-containing protein n=1 Tax=Streptomyces mangrovisoli TaxID=1428628 RepID=A0A1J4NKN4_9ACTN|nr:hypothetical protein [Streptomyces mangrovisoli]OIJ62953.1 hypothetical protein WN71_036270 [Streptomyces mangrovisoli]